MPRLLCHTVCYGLKRPQVLGKCSTSTRMCTSLCLKKPTAVQVFHTAEHSRHQHSLGVAELAYRLARKVASKVDTKALCRLREEDVIPSQAQFAQVALAGLAHDLGHGPFSHLWERCMEQLTEKKW
jgi:HD superfamily phosphohydrolase